MKQFAARLDSAGAVAPLALRLGVGLVITWHGWQKIDGGVSNFAGFVDSLGIPAPTAVAYAVTALEFAGGIMILAGFLTRIPALLLALQMALTAFWVKMSELNTGFIAAEGVGYELDLLILVGALALAVIGPGAVSVDAAIGIEASEPAERQGLVRAPTAA